VHHFQLAHGNIYRPGSDYFDFNFSVLAAYWIAKNFGGLKLYSSAFRDVRNKKSKFEANAHLYIILCFMIGAIVLCGFVTSMSIDNFAPRVSNQFQYKP